MTWSQWSATQPEFTTNPPRFRLRVEVAQRVWFAKVSFAFVFVAGATSVGPAGLVADGSKPLGTGILARSGSTESVAALLREVTG